MVFHGGYDSTVEESYLVVAAGALRRGYNVIAFDGPGQGSCLRDQGLHFRPDWEAVVTPVVDFALTVPEVDAGRLALMGMSLGGYLAARAAAFEHRIAACLLYDELTCPKELITFREDEGAGEHCQEGALFLFHQRTFDWLDTLLHLSAIH